MTDLAVTKLVYITSLFTDIHIDKVSGFPDIVFVFYLLQTFKLQ